MHIELKTSDMKKFIYLAMLFASCFATTACTSVGDYEDIFQNYINTGGSASSNTAGQSASIGDLTSFDVTLNRTALTEHESVPADDEDYIEYTGNDFSSTVTIAYDGNDATVSTVDGVNITKSGGHITVSSTAKGVKYIISGTTANGSLKLYSDKKYELVLNGADITNPDSAAINLQSKKRAYIVLADGTVNKLTDGTGYKNTGSEDMKGTLFAEGKLLFSGSGSLEVYANAKNGIASDDYILIRPNANIYVKATAGNGIKSNDGIAIRGGNINVKTSGNRYNYSSSLHSSPKGIKSGGNMIISGGEVSVTLSGTGDGCEAIESKAQITINGGYVYAYSYDDAINSAHDFIINDGYVFARGTNNDGIDANRNIYINGGNVIAVGGSRPENAIDAAEGYNIYINGGNVFGIGGSTAATASASKQASIAFTSSVSGKKLGLFDSNGNGLMYIEVPVTSCTAVYMTANGMAANGKYTIKSGVTVSGGETWNGINTTGTISGGSSLTTATAAAQVGSSMGGGGRPW